MGDSDCRLLPWICLFRYEMDERFCFVARLLKGEKMAALCREFDISRKTPRGCPGVGLGMYFPTARGEIRIPSFSNSSSAIRSCPHSGFSMAILRISRRSSTGIAGRPALFFHRQRIRQPIRCQRITVEGRTLTTASRHSKNRVKSDSLHVWRNPRAWA